MVFCIVFLLALIMSAAFACSSGDDGSLTQTTPIGTARIWVNAINNHAITEIASCLYDVSSADYADFVHSNQDDYAIFEQVQFVAITDYKEVGRNDAYAKYDITLSIKRELVATTENGTATEALTTIDNITSSFHFKKTSANQWLFTTEPHPTAGNAEGEGFTLETEELAIIPVNFETNGGVSIATQEVQEGSTIVAPDNPLRIGYTFAGWYTGQSYQNEWDFDTIITADVKEMTLYAKWLDEGALSNITISEIRYFDEYTHAVDNNYVISAVKSRHSSSGTQYSFSTGIAFSTAPDHWGVYLDRDGSIPSPKIVDLTPGETTQVYVIITAPNGSDTVVYQFNIYLKRDYTLSFVENGEPIAGLAPMIVEEGEAINSLPWDLTKAGYNLVSWIRDGIEVNDNTIVREDMILSPVWEAKPQDVTLQCHGGSLASGAVSATTTITYGEIVNIEVPKKTGYLFRCWNLHGRAVTDDKGKLLAPWAVYDQTDVRLEAVYEQETYNISYLGIAGLDYDGIASYKYEQYTNGNPYVFPEPAKDGYEFSGWQRVIDDNNLETITQIDSSVSGDLELRAVWLEMSYDIIYNTFDGTYDESALSWKEVTSMRDQKKYKEELATTPLEAEGLTFVGWYLEPSFKTLLTSSYRPTATTNLYARWTEGYTEGLNFSVTKDGKYEVRQYSGRADTVVIPSTYLGIEVVGIAASCFRNQPLVSIDLTKATNLKSIGSGAFENCPNLTSIVIPESVTAIGDGVFSGCASLASIVLPTYASSTAGNLGKLFGRERSGVVSSFYEVQQTVADQDVRTYYVPKTLTSITIASSNITAGYMENMSSVKSLTISSLTSSTTIGVAAFRGCTSLVTLTIPSTITAIGKEAFSGCVGLDASFAIPAAVVEIGARAFEGVTIPLTMPSGLAKLNDNALEGYRGTTVDLANVTELGKYSFKNAVNLTEIYNLTKVGVIGQGAFVNCMSLSSVSLSSSLSRIEADTFSMCIALSNLTLGPSVSFIGANAFYGCDNTLELTLYRGTTSVTPLESCVKTLIYV